MEPYYSDNFITLYCGDAREILPKLEPEVAQACVTSPPYFGLRNYGVDGQIGLEESPLEFVRAITDVFVDVQRALRIDGTLWLNLGDSYANDGKWGGSTGNKHAAGLHGNTSIGREKKNTGLKAKELVGIPWTVAFALRDLGFYLRQDIIWHKPNPMPESVKDRCTKAHEYLFLLTKSAKYHCDMDAIKEPAVGGLAGNTRHRGTVAYTNGDEHHRTKGGLVKYAEKQRDSWKGSQFDTGKTAVHQLNRSQKERDRSLRRNRNGITGSLDAWTGPTRNKRSVWTVPTQPFPEAHFATFPAKLITPCILAGSREGDIVLDPFAGAGTTLLVARSLKRRAIGIELSPEYCQMIVKRITEVKG